MKRGFFTFLSCIVFLTATWTETVTAQEYKKIRVTASYHNNNMTLDGGRVGHPRGEYAMDGYGTELSGAFNLSSVWGVEFGYLKYNDEQILDLSLGDRFHYRFSGYHLLGTAQGMSPQGFFVRGKAGATYGTNKLTNYESYGSNSSWSGLYPMFVGEAGYLLGRGKKVAVEFIAGYNLFVVEDVDVSGYYSGVGIRF